MDARIFIDLETATPPYEQVQSQISSLIAVGALQPGTRLPTVRSLAADLGVAAGTVARAYKELEAAGLVVTNRRQGTVVAASVPTMPKAGAVEPPHRVMAAVEHLIVEGEKAGLDSKMLLTLLQGRLNQRGK
ncbi:DNA-binding transcriptional regulator YhcF (GntR family) [Arthrobacter stackebrandtii]|uniref:DNA-binding transcriptional regulator YhcF (GntR family) n=1 Tax=Arthrobacter stackebrandtii TaxID=272161 RepID=A0ABS4YX25_9MICC|nr:GntR family transcriptional regulator [Arthrobacter stackebrandtii]MBP2413269.1 DNA-binding transcriptional regulator YhcF (GntR family) [Arthrobacter stackebrandtii]PYH00988.1 GntR family transcriptional regulator [Arthrobacter stackebrandtii]